MLVNVEDENVGSPRLSHWYNFGNHHQEKQPCGGLEDLASAEPTMSVNKSSVTYLKAEWLLSFEAHKLVECSVRPYRSFPSNSGILHTMIIFTSVQGEPQVTGVASRLVLTWGSGA